MSKKIRVAVTGLNNTDNPAPGWGVIKSLKDLPNVKIVGLTYSPSDSVGFLIDEVYLMPYPNQGWALTKEKLKDLNIDILIPNLDAELPIYIKNKKELNEIGIKTLLPNIKTFEKRNKHNLEKLCRELDLKTPVTFTVNGIGEIEKLITKNKLSFPFFIKGVYYKAYEVKNFEQLVDKFTKITNEWGYPVIVQEKIKGEEINYLGLAAEGNLLGGMGMKKFSTTDLGKVWTAISIKNDKLFETAKKFSKIWQGPFELEAISKGEEIYLLEINPRFPAWVYFSTACGINLPELMVRYLQGDKVSPKLEYEENKFYFRYVEEGVTDITEYIKLLTKGQK